MAVEQAYAKIGNHLRTWGTASIAVGGVALAVGLLVLPAPTAQFVTGLGIQFLVWGAIDTILAIIASRRAMRLLELQPDEELEMAKRLGLRKTLRRNGLLDFFYIAAGIALVVLLDSAAAAGHGTGIIVQALFLLWFDFAHAARLPKAPAPWYDPEP